MGATTVMLAPADRSCARPLSRLRPRGLGYYAISEKSAGHPWGKFITQAGPVVFAIYPNSHIQVAIGQGHPMPADQRAQVGALPTADSTQLTKIKTPPAYTRLWPFRGPVQCRGPVPASARVQPWRRRDPARLPLQTTGMHGHRPALHSLRPYT